jgi:hypothetical protein
MISPNDKPFFDGLIHGWAYIRNLGLRIFIVAVNYTVNERKYIIKNVIGIHGWAYTVFESWAYITDLEIHKSVAYIRNGL